MKKKITLVLIILCIFVIISNINGLSAYENIPLNSKGLTTYKNNYLEDEYEIQWEKNYGSDPTAARLEGPQPIGDCDNDGENELLIGGRDAVLRVYEWSTAEQTYIQTHSLHSPFYNWFRFMYKITNGEYYEPPDADGFAIGDLTGDGKNEIAVSWYTTVHKYIAGKYRIIGWNPWVEWQGGGNADCYIGDCDNDGKNELIISCSPFINPVPEIVVFGWNGWRLVKESHWDDPEDDAMVFMAGLGDVDYDGENEIVCGSGNKVAVLDWNKAKKEFDSTIIKRTTGWKNYPFACVCKDSDMDGKAEIHVGYYGPKISIFKWNGEEYTEIFETEWPDEGMLIEGLDVGDVDDDGRPEVCAGTDDVHILEWNGTTYIEEAVIDETYGHLAVVSVGDCDNDGKNEIHAGAVIVKPGEEYKSWVFKYGWNSNYQISS
jgi:hypothetical protein